MELQLRCGRTGESKGTVEVSDARFGREYNEPLIHQVVTAYMAAARSGTSAQKTRSEVSGGGKKPWKQKGGGRARAGTIRSPIWRTGGVTFASKTRNYEQKVNRKMYRAAMNSILSELVRQERLIVVDAFTVEAIKTSQLKKRLEEMNLLNVLIVTEHLDSNLFLSARNIHGVDVIDSTALDPVSLIAYENVMITSDALKSLEEAA